MSPLWPQFVGPSYTLRSATLDTELTLNLFHETLETATNPKPRVLYGTPGLLDLGAANDVVSRGQFAQDGRQFAVIGPTLYEYSLAGAGLTVSVASISNRGTVANDGSVVYLASNGPGGNQLAIVSAGKLYIFNLSTNTLSAAISLPLTNAPGPIVFLNSFFLLVEVNTLKVWFSEFEDGTTWNGLDFFARSNVSDDVVGLAVLYDQVRVFGSKSSEWFYNVGDADNPFIPYPGSVSLDGAINATCITALGDSIVWVAKNQWDLVRVMQIAGGEPRVISTPAVEFALGQYSTVTDVEVLPYELEGHPTAVWTFPTADRSWAWDARENAWHQVSSPQTGDATVPPFPLHRWRARGVCAPSNQAIIVGDVTTGHLYLLSLDVFTEICGAIPRVRRAPYLSSENQWLFLEQAELGIQSGVGKATGAVNDTTGQVYLRVSRDSGNTYSSTLTSAMGAAGAWLARAIWRRLGRARADRLVLEVSTNAIVRVVFGPGMWLRFSPGSGQL